MRRSFTYWFWCTVYYWTGSERAFARSEKGASQEDLVRAFELGWKLSAEHEAQRNA